MQEFKYFKDGATLVISLDGLNWLSKRKCKDKGVKKRDEELQALVSSGQMVQSDEELQPITCLCILDQRGRTGPQLWRKYDHRSSLVTRLPSFSIPPRQCRPLKEPSHQSALTSSASSVLEYPKEAPWTRLILNMQEIFSFFKRDLNIVTQQDAATETQHNRFIIFYNDNIPQQVFSDRRYSEDCWTSIGDTGWQITDNSVICDSKSSTAHWSHSPNTGSSEGGHHELVSRCNRKSLLKSCQIYTAPQVSSDRVKTVKWKKSVSFDDDVLVFLFDQESPTMELHAEPCTPPPSNLPDVTLEDSGLEWEDDFSALEKSCSFQCIRQTASQHYTLSLPTHNCSALSRRRFLSQTCLFLTHVTESDLEM